jgi:cytochrome d ubiquinol oxidase subunit I
MDYVVEVPKLSSLILKHDLNAPLTGLDAYPADRVPPVSILFWSFRIMVGLGFAMLGLGFGACGRAGADVSLRIAGYSARRS